MKEGYVSKGVFLKDNFLKFYFSGNAVKSSFVGLESQRSLGLNRILSTSQLSPQTRVPVPVAAVSAGFMRRPLSWAACVQTPILPRSGVALL